VPTEKLEEETFVFTLKLISKSPVTLQMGKRFYSPMIDYVKFREISDAAGGSIVYTICKSSLYISSEMEGETS
jgi:hypothetical protein